ncbi:MAG: hypothetical protein ACRDTA_21530 [Pseudonocardiaceae bacterium]
MVSLAGCADLALISHWRLGSGAANDLMGGTPGEHPGRYALADPSVLLPESYRRSTCTARDGVVPIAIGRKYADRAHQAGSPVEFIELPAVEHFALIDPMSTA